MATSSIVLDIKANTDRALNDFKRFSAQLDNKFLVSGLKLDVVRNALGQINREFQKAIGEQGLQAGQSLRAAQNQAALLINTFKTIGPAASEAIANDFSSAFSEIAVRAGGTAKDIQKALSAVPFISTDLPEDMRKALGKGIMEFQRDFSRAGLGDTYGNIIREFLAGQTTAGQLANSIDPLKSMLGTELTRLGGTQDLLPDAKQRSSVVKALQDSQQMRDTLAKMADRANYGQFIIQDLNTRLFNPEKGVFGVLRQVTMSVKDKTSIFIETRSLIESVFGRQGLFVNFFKQIAKIFGIEDPLKVIIIGVRFITKQFEALNAFIQSSQVQDAIKFATETFTRVKDFFTSLYKEVSKGTFDKESIIQNIKGLGETIRSYIKKIGDAIGGKDITKETEFGSSIIGTLAEEMGKTMLALIRDIGGALLLKAPQIGLSLSGELVKALGNVISTAFQDPLTGTLATAAGGFLAYKGLRAVGGAVGGIRNTLNSPGGMLGAVNRHFGSPFGVGSDRQHGVGGAMGFHSQVIGRMDAIIRILAGGGATDIDYGGPRSPVDGGPRRGGGDGDDGGRRGSRSRRFRGRTQYPGSIGPLPMNSAEAWAYDGDDFQPYLDADRTDARGRSTRQRFNSRYGSGGRRALMGRGLGRMGRGVARVAGGRVGLALGVAGIGLSVLNAGGVLANTKEEIDPQTGQPIPAQPQKVGAGAAWGAVGMGAAEGALTGAMFGPWGAAIGGVIGGGIKLFDRGIRDAIIESVAWFARGTASNAKKLWDGFMSNITKTFDGIKSYAGSIDWKTILIDTLLPGRGLVRTAVQAAGISRDNEDSGPLSTFKNWILGILGVPGKGVPGKEVGGPVIKGTSYIVGERGPEIFTPGQTGTISTNRELMALGSKGYNGSSVSANFNISINVNGNMGAGDVELLRAPVLRIVEEAWAAATQGSVSRGVVG